MFFVNVLYACLVLLLSPEAHMKWFLHVVSQVAVKSCLGSVRAFAGPCMHLRTLKAHLGSFLIYF